MENIRIAIGSIQTNLLRAILTILIIAFGIMALVGILSSLDALKASLSDSLAMMGSNTFTIRNRGFNIRVGRRGERTQRNEPISFRQAMEFKERYNFPASVSVSMRKSGSTTIKHRGEKTNPNVSVFGADQEYLTASGYELAKGRNFSVPEELYGSYVAIIGNEIKKNVFKPGEDVINSKITVDNMPYKVIGLLEEKGSSFGRNPDNVVIIPIKNTRKHTNSDRENYVISVTVDDVKKMDAATSEATGLFRNIRKLKLREKDNFDFVKSDSIITMLLEQTAMIQMGTIIIGMITLLGSAIGLMNILLVSVTERTREIGVRKALGATGNEIIYQFLTEAIVISMIGGLLGIIAGIGMGNLVSMLFKGGFIIPWLWMLLGVFLCLLTGIVAGLYPAVKASRLDPIEALRHE